MLLVVGTVVIGATGLKKTRIDRQFMSKMSVGGMVEQQIFLVVPKLVRDCILGIDCL